MKSVDQKKIQNDVVQQMFTDIADTVFHIERPENAEQRPQKKKHQGICQGCFKRKTALFGNNQNQRNGNRKIKTDFLDGSGMRERDKKKKNSHQNRDAIAQGTPYFFSCALLTQLRCMPPDLIPMHNSVPEISRSEECCLHHLTTSKIPDILLVGKMNIMLKLLI